MGKGTTNRDVNIKPTDGGYGWVVVASAFLVGFIVDGFAYSFGILLIDLLEHFEQDRASTVAIGSIQIGMTYLIGPLAGAMSDVYGCRVIVFTGAVISSVGFIISAFANSVIYLYFTYGILGGIGFGLMYVPAKVCVIQHFTQRRGLANGIAFCGSGVGAFSMTHLIRYMLDHYGWRGTMLLDAGIALQGTVLGLLLLPPGKTLCFPYMRPCDNTETVNGSELKVYNIDMTLGPNDGPQVSANAQPGQALYEKKASHLKRVIRRTFNIKLLTHGGFLLFLLASLCTFLAFYIPFNALPDQAVESGMTKHEASWLISSIGITNILSRFGLGWLADRKCVSRMVMLDIVIFLAGVSTALSPLLTTFETKLSFTCFYGIMTGGYITLCPVVLADLFGADMIARSFGMYVGVTGVASFASSPIGGLLYDTTKSYDITFVVAGAEFLLAAILLLCSACVSRKKDNT